MNLNLNEKTAVVCGSTQGIGKASAMILADLGANIVLLSRNSETIQQTLEELPQNANQKHSFLVADFKNNDEVEAVITGFAKSQTAHILINNTGGPAAGEANAANKDEYINAFKMHLVNNQILAQVLIPGMKKEGYGRIINVISTSVKAPIPGLGVSNTIRGAVANWAKTMAGELGRFNITVNNVLPGLTETERLFSLIRGKAEKAKTTYEEMDAQLKNTVPMKRFATAEECGNAVAFLASPAAAYINGINLPVDGGRTQSL